MQGNFAQILGQLDHDLPDAMIGGQLFDPGRGNCVIRRKDMGGDDLQAQAFDFQRVGFKPIDGPDHLLQARDGPQGDAGLHPLKAQVPQGPQGFHGIAPAGA